MDSYSESSNCVECKKSSKCFQKLVTSELEFINKNKTQIVYKKGENICKQGAFASYVLYISDGLVKLYLEGPNNKNINIKILRASDFIGLSSIYGENIYDYSVVALKDTTVCLIEKESFKKLILNNSEFASELIKGYTKNERQYFSIIQSIGNKQMNGRLAETLIYLSKEDFLKEDIFSYVSRKDIADFSCISTESTVRLLSDLNKENIIKLEGKKIEIINPVALRRISITG